MADILVRNVDQEDLARIEEKAAAVGLSRNEYLRRHIEADARRDVSPVTSDHLNRFAGLSRDLGDEEVMREAWS